MRSPTRTASFAVFALLAGCAQTCGKGDAPTPDAAPPAAPSASVATAGPRVHHEARAPELRPSHAGDDAWVKTAAHAKSYASIDLAKGSDPAAPLRVEWRVYPAQIELYLARGNVSKRLALGEPAGAPAATGLTYCRATGYVPATRWTMPQLANVMASFSTETMQTADETFLLLGRDILHVMHHRTAQCDAPVPQGPLDVCPDAKWEVAYDVKMAGEPQIQEVVNEVDSDGGAPRPFECDPGSGLLPSP